MELFGGDGGGGAQGAVMVASAAVVANPVNSDSGSDGEPVVDEANSDAVLAPDLLLIRLYGRTLMQLGPLMPVLFVFFGMMNAYNRNEEFMAWEQEARCTADDTPPFDACRDDYEAAGNDDSWEYCQAKLCSVSAGSVHIDEAVIGPEHVEQFAPWTEGQPCPTGYGQRCFSAGEIDPQELEPLNVLYRGLAGVASLVIGAVSFSFRRVTAPEGTLNILGVGDTKISESAARGLQRWQIPLGVGCGMSTFFGLVGRGHWMEGPIYLFVWPSALVWYLALKEASILVSDAVLEARKELAVTSVLDKDWDSSVVPKILQLAQKTLPDLSHGFGTGLFTLATAFWLLSASAFASSLRELRLSGFFRSFNLFCFPLLVAIDVASASSDCDSLVVALNEKRKQTMDLETDQKLQVLERALALENAGEGIGFCVLGAVVDRKTLTRIFLLVMGTLGTILPIIVALRPQEHPAGTDVCLLSSTQKSAVQALVASWGNSSCTYNVTLNDILADA